MKKVSKKLRSIGCTAAAIILAHGSFAQTLQLPTGADQLWVTGTSSPIIGLNTAQICYNSMSPMAISAVVYYDGTGTEQINIFDNYFFTSTTIPYSGLGSLDGVPDVILGDNLAMSANPLTDFLVTVAFRNNSGNVEVDVYTFTDNFGSFSGVGLLNSVTSSSYTYSPGTVHLDNEMDGTGSWGFPIMSRFALTWDDNSVTPNHVYAVIGDMNSAVLANFGVGTGVFDTHQISASGMLPDIAGVNCTPGGYSAWITYVNASSGNKLLGAFYQPGGSTLNTQVLDNGSTSLAIKEPRIACIPGGSGIMPFSGTTSTFMVTTEAYNSSTSLWEVRNYDPPAIYAGAATGWTISSVEDISSVPPYSFFTPPYFSLRPTIAFGPNDYLTLHFLEYSGAGTDVLMLDPMDCSNWSALADPPSYYYYWVNSTSSPYPSPTTSSVYVCAEATPCNSFSSNSVSAWAAFNGSNYVINYKFSNPAAGSIAFRQSQPAAQAAPEAPKLNIYPNPANSILDVSNVTGVADVAYEVVNMAGQLVMQGTLSGSTASLNVSKLTAGNYTMKMHNSAVSTNMMFTKE